MVLGGAADVRIFLTLPRHDSRMWCMLSRVRVPYFPLSMLVFPAYHLGAFFSSCPCFCFSFSFITCGFYHRITLALPPLHL